MINYIKGNIFESEAEALVNPVNTVGVMGKGLAAQFKSTFPVNHKEYVLDCKKGSLKVGKLCTVFEEGVWIVNFPTKEDWKNPSKLEWIDEGLKTLKQWIEFRKVKSIAVPALGCGNGGLYWGNVKPMIEYHLNDVPDLDVFVYLP
jgi:O-acetyl-ADP-ribose deacetylase (regulator of RNase III)